MVGYCYGIRSERRLCEEVHLNLAYRWFCGLGLEGISRTGVMACRLIAQALREARPPGRPSTGASKSGSAGCSGSIPRLPHSSSRCPAPLTM